MKISKERIAQIIKEEYQKVKKEQEETVGADIEKISPEDVLGTQPGVGFDTRSSEAFTQLFTRYRKPNGTIDYAQMGEDFEKLDPDNQQQFIKFILRNPLIFNMMKRADVDFALDLDPDAPLNLDMSDYEKGAPETKE